MIPENLLRGGIDGGDGSFLVRNDDAERRASDDRPVEVEGTLEIFLVLMTGGYIGDRCGNTVRQFDDLNLITSRLAFGLKDGAGEFDQGRFSGFGDFSVALEEIGGTYRRKDFAEIVSEHLASVHADHSFGVAVEKDELEVADLAGGVVDVVIEDDGVGAGFCGGDEPKLVVARAGRIPDDEGEAAHGDGEPGNEDGSCKGACPGEEFDDPGIIGGEGS